MKLFIKEISKNQFKIKIINDINTNHTVTLDDDYFNKLTKNKTTKKKLIEFSFFFLLTKEKNTSILPEFELEIISKYFPEYEDKVSLWCLENFSSK
tara:strand:- start:79 stop:366 length:288 start_codon:yes stop_codon:yes gene_type:complete